MRKSRPESAHSLKTLHRLGDRVSQSQDGLIVVAHKIGQLRRRGFHRTNNPHTGQLESELIHFTLSRHLAQRHGTHW